MDRKTPIFSVLSLFIWTVPLMAGAQDQFIDGDFEKSGNKVFEKQRKFDEANRGNPVPSPYLSNMISNRTDLAVWNPSGYAKVVLYGMNAWVELSVKSGYPASIGQTIVFKQNPMFIAFDMLVVEQGTQASLNVLVGGRVVKSFPLSQSTYQSRFSVSLREDLTFQQNHKTYPSWEPISFKLEGKSGSEAIVRLDNIEVVY